MVDESKGKGKAAAQRDDDNAGTNQPTSSSSSGNAASTAAQTLASALRTTMASSQLGSLMASASGGKADFVGTAAGGGGPGGELRDWLVQDLRSSPASSDATWAAGNVGGKRMFRSAEQSGVEAQQRDQKLFDDFQQGLSLNSTSGAEFAPTSQTALVQGDNNASFNSAWESSVQGSRASRWEATGLDPAIAQPIHSYSQLDSPLHASVRSDYHHQPAIARPSAPANAAPLAQTQDIFALLDEEGQTSAPTTVAPMSVASTSTTRLPGDLGPNQDLSHEVLSKFDPIYRRPSPTNSGFSREQATLHLQLAEAQASEQGRQELAVPRPDNPALEEGVYARTAEDALRSIFDGREESNEVKEEKERLQGDRGKEVVRKITRWFAGSSYIQDVYGLPPLLRETIEVVEKDGADEEKREKAIRRLESLWGHLSNTNPQSHSQGSDWVDGWLRTNT
ncbi:uncharacterized protein UTRI_02661_B [Ustilago trichophora]|uniref:Uncharacterized protein n=1 Tax=Ustilago trichophora TaxID=86804 RepID=A0A5C3E577_9BASI|nr:uncharacterized protein UTRI_02661_B [Ustilago trichophora]